MGNILRVEALLLFPLVLFFFFIQAHKRKLYILIIFELTAPHLHACVHTRAVSTSVVKLPLICSEKRLEEFEIERE